MIEKFNYSWKDFDEDLSYFQAVVEGNKINHVVTLYRGGLALGLALSNRCNLPLSIIKYQSYDGKDKKVKFIHKANIKKTDNIIVVDDLADTGNSIVKVTSFLREQGYSNITVCTIHGNRDFKNKFGWLYCREKNPGWEIYPWE